MDNWDAFIQSFLQAGATRALDFDPPRIGCFRDPAQEYMQLERGPALVDRGYRALLEVRGADRVNWLRNLVTNEIKHLGVGEGQYAFALNIQGRILFDVNVCARPDCLWLDLDRRFVDLARAHLKKYIITEDVAIADQSDEFIRLALAGAGAKETLAALGLGQASAMSQLGTTAVRWGHLELPVMRHDFCGPFALELFVPVAHAVSTWQALTDPSGPYGAIPVGADAVEVRRIQAGIPWPFREITSEYLPAETGQLARAVSFTKGCYLGQEIVERMRSRKAVARQLVGLLMESNEAPPSGAAIAAPDGSPVGLVTSACRSPAGKNAIGLGYVKTAFAALDTPLTASWPDRTVPARVSALPFVSG